jgi:hypothetical protein
VVSTAVPSRPLISVFRTRVATFPFKSLLIYPHEAEWTPFQAQYYSENLVAPQIEPGTSGTATRNSDRQTTEVVLPALNYRHNYGNYPSSCLYFKHNVLETGFCLFIGPNWVDFT